jgi:hypothetical protein
VTQSQIDLIIANAPKLRAAGILSLSFNGDSVHSVHLAAAEPDLPPPEHPAELEVEYSDPLMDPDTYPGGKVPKLRRNGAKEH